MSINQNLNKFKRYINNRYENIKSIYTREIDHQQRLP